MQTLPEVAPSKIKLFNAGLEALIAGTLQNGKATESYYKTLVYHDLSSREHTKMLYEHGLLKVDVARFS